MTTAAALQVGMRCMIRKDLAPVAAIDRASFLLPWTETDFLTVQRQSHCHGMVVSYRRRVIGYWLMRLCPREVNVLHFCVSPEYRRMGVGRQMVDTLKDCLAPNGRTRIIMEIRESNTSAHHFFHSQGFRAVTVLREHYSDTGEDAYVFEYALSEL